MLVSPVFSSSTTMDLISSSVASGDFNVSASPVIKEMPCATKSFGL